MPKLIMLLPVLALAACSNSPAIRAEEECRTALHGVENHPIRLGPKTIECKDRITKAEKVARENILDDYRALSRLPEEENESPTDTQTEPATANE